MPKVLASQRHKGSFLESKARTDVLKVRQELLKAGSLFKDEDFPPVDSPDIAWVRPTDLSAAPRLTVDPILLDVQNLADDCGSFVSAFATISMCKELVTRLCPDSQGFAKNDYCGLFYFLFWKFGEWVIVPVDDRLPYSTSQRKLLRLRSKRPDEYFFSLLEKAYAKFIGGYGELATARAGDILVDMTGGVSELWTMSKKHANDWFPGLKKLAESQLPATANFEKLDCASRFDARITYVLKDVVSFNLPDSNKEVWLVKLADPWGKLIRYTGDWNNESPEWRKVPQHLREKLAPNNDGSAGAVYEFWMTFYDFISTFTYVQFCVVSPKDMGPVDQGVKWTLTTIKGRFPGFIPTTSNLQIKSSTAYDAYPQYVVELADVDNFSNDGKCELVVSLSQKTISQGEKWMTMGFSLFHLKNSKDRPPLTKAFFNDNVQVAASQISSSREVVSRIRLFPGSYVLVIMTTPEFKKRDFLVRIFKHQRYDVCGHVITYTDESAVSAVKDTALKVAALTSPSVGHVSKEGGRKSLSIKH